MTNRNPPSDQGVYTTLTSTYQADTSVGELARAPGRLTPAEASSQINDCAAGDDLELCYALKIEEQMAQLDLSTGDLIHLLRKGFVYDEPVQSTRDGYFKYTIEGATPNSGGRTIYAVVIPTDTHKLKVASVSDVGAQNEGAVQ